MPTLNTVTMVPGVSRASNKGAATISTVRPVSPVPRIVASHEQHDQMRAAEMRDVEDRGGCQEK